MINVKKREINLYFNCFLKSIILIFFVTIIFLVYNYKILLNQFLFYETVPYYKIIFDKECIAKFKKEMYNKDTKKNIRKTKETFDSYKVESSVILKDTDIILGEEDIAYQCEDECSRNLKEKFKYEDIEKYRDPLKLINTFYLMDKSVGIIEDKFNIDKFLNTNLKIEKDINKPKILIMHTHAASEFFSDSNSDNLYEGVVGAGKELARILEEKYNIKSIHYTGVHDKIEGKINRNGAYERIEPEAKKILNQNPSIELVIDLHRDGISPNSKVKLSTEINNKKVAKIMFVNGVSAMNEDGNIKELSYLPNPNIETNLALSFNMQMEANEFYPDFTRKIYLKPYRYTNHLLPKSLLIELGSQYTTKEEAFNSMEIIADLLNRVVF